MKRFLSIMICLFFLCGHTVNIIATVRGVPISSQDIEEGMAIARSPLFGGTSQESKEVKNKVLDTLVEQILILDEASRFGLIANEQEVNNYIINNFRINNLSLLKKKMQENNLNYEKLFMQAKAQATLKKIVNEIILLDVVVTDEEILEWREQSNNKYNKKYNLYRLYGKPKLPKDAYQRRIDCSNVELFANDYGLKFDPKQISLDFSDMTNELKTQIISGLGLHKISKPFYNNEFIVICSTEKIDQLQDDDIYKLLYVQKIEANKKIFLNKIRSKYYAEK